LKNAITICHADAGGIFYTRQIAYLSILEDPLLSRRVIKNQNYNILA